MRGPAGRAWKPQRGWAGLPVSCFLTWLLTNRQNSLLSVYAELPSLGLTVVWATQVDLGLHVQASNEPALGQELIWMEILMHLLNQIDAAN